MKILLIRPPFAIEKFYFPRFINEPLGIEYLASWLSSKKHTVKIVDCLAEEWNNYYELLSYPEIIFQGLKIEKLLKKIKKYQPDVIGITWLFSTQNSSISFFIKKIKEAFPQTPLIVGGAEPSANPKKILENFPQIDLVVYGEGEITLQEILDNQLKNLETIKGLAYRQDNKIIINPARELITNLDILPHPYRDSKLHQNYSKQFIYQAWYLKLNKKFKIKNQQTKINLSSKLSSLPFLSQIYYKLHNARNRKKLPAADIITSRGCPNRCTFCAIRHVWGQTCRMRSAQDVLKEIDLLVKKFGIKHLNLQDDNFNVSKKRTLEICQGIVKNNYQISLIAPAGAFVPTLDEEVLWWLKKAGLTELRMSIESGDSYILHEIIKKNINLDKVKEIVNICKKLNIYTEGAFMFGVPGETIETMQRSLDYAEQTDFDRIVKFIFQPFPNTELYDICIKNNYLTPDYNPNKVYITGNQGFVKTEKFSPADVVRIVGR